MRLLSITFRIVLYAIVTAVAVSFLLPFLWMVTTSLKSDSQVFANPPVLFPKPAHWSNYKAALEFMPVWQYLLNTLFVCITSTTALVASSALVAYGFAKVDWRGRDAVFIILLATMMLPGQVTMIPQFILFDKLGWIGTYKPLIVPGLFGSAFFVFLLRQFYLGLPGELSDAARIDGCSEFGIFRRIILPLSKPALLTCAFFAFVGGWNDFMGPLIYLNDESMYTLSLGLQQFLGQHQQEWSQLMAVSTLMILPVLGLFLGLQKSLVQSLAFSGIKE